MRSQSSHLLLVRFPYTVKKPKKTPKNPTSVSKLSDLSRRRKQTHFTLINERVQARRRYKANNNYTTNNRKSKSKSMDITSPPQIKMDGKYLLILYYKLSCFVFLSICLLINHDTNMREN